MLAILGLAISALVGGSDLPDGEGRAAVEGVCLSCHSDRTIRRALGYDRAGWQALTSAMIDLSADLDLEAEVLDYLTRTYPAGSGRTAVRTDGPYRVTFEEWAVPTLGQRPRDPVEMSDGTIWWAGQSGNNLGRIKPDGSMQEYALPKGAQPHSVLLGPDETIWYTGNRNGTIGQLDPETGDVREYPMPDPAARDPHTAVFDADGILWFTLQQSNMIGRLDPATGKVDLMTAPTPRSRPYGIKLDASGTPWVACNGSNCLLRVATDSLTLTEIKLPEAGTTVRRLDIDADGMIWFVNSRLGRLGRYNPATGAVTEWPSPSGPKSHPYAIAVTTDGAVWYNESGTRPDMLVRFDPDSESFQSFEIPAGGVTSGIVRHMRATKDGGLVLHQTASNRILKMQME